MSRRLVYELTLLWKTSKYSTSAGGTSRLEVWEHKRPFKLLNFWLRFIRLRPIQHFQLVFQGSIKKCHICHTLLIDHFIMEKAKCTEPGIRDQNFITPFIFIRNWVFQCLHLCTKKVRIWDQKSWYRSIGVNLVTSKKLGSLKSLGPVT